MVVTGALGCGILEPRDRGREQAVVVTFFFFFAHYGWVVGDIYTTPHQLKGARAELEGLEGIRRCKTAGAWTRRMWWLVDAEEEDEEEDENSGEGKRSGIVLWVTMLRMLNFTFLVMVALQIIKQIKIQIR